MLTVQRYELTAKHERADALLGSLETLASWLMRRDGCQRVEIERNVREGEVITFSEYWRDEQARLAAGLEVNRDLLGAIFDSSERVADRRSMQIRVFERPARGSAVEA